MKRLVLILLVVLILFGIMLSCGLTRDHSSSRASDRPSWMGLLEPLKKNTPVAAAEILPSPCFTQGDLLAKPNQACIIHIRTSQESDVRTMKLAMIVGASAKVNLQTHGQTGMEVEIPLRSSAPKSPELQIPKDGAEVKVSCVEPAPDPAAGSSMGQIPGCRLRMTK